MPFLQVVLMNQVTTKVLDNNRGSKLVPALGEPALNPQCAWSEQTGDGFRSIGPSFGQQLSVCHAKSWRHPVHRPLGYSMDEMAFFIRCIL